jgi:3-phytase
MVIGLYHTTKSSQVQTFAVPIEGETCTVFLTGEVFFSADDQPLYAFQAAESTTAPQVRSVSEKIEVASIATYHGASNDYLFVAHDQLIDIYDSTMKQQGSIGLKGIPKLEIKSGLSILQSSVDGYPSGAIALAFEGEDDEGVAVASLDGVLAPLGIQVNTNYDPNNKPCKNCEDNPSNKCSNYGFATGYGGCSCFAGFADKDYSETTRENNCSGHGNCDGPNVCKCKEGWTGSGLLLRRGQSQIGDRSQWWRWRRSCHLDSPHQTGPEQNHHHHQVCRWQRFRCL